MHPNRDQLAGYVFGTLAEDAAETIATHVEECPVCEDTVRNLEATGDDVLARLRQPAVPEPFAEESGCEKVLALIDAIGREPSFTRADGTQRSGRSAAAEVLDENLGQIRVYKLLAKLGHGGMGTVYKALHTELDKVVALKVLPADRLQDKAAVDRFKREMKAVGKLEHPNLVRAMDAGEDAGTHYLVMELIDGIDLAALVKQHGPLPVPAACEIIRQAAVGLQYAHEHGLVHRDIKPSNIMVSGQWSVVSSAEKPRGYVPAGFQHRGDVAPRLPNHDHTPAIKILDMGLALLAGTHHDGEELTSTGQIMGTVDYMAPEQGSDTHRVDIRADLYSLGATLYKLLTGRAPFEGPKFNSPMKKLTALATQPPQPIRELRPDVPADLAAIVHQLLAKSPNERPATPRAVAQLLSPFASAASLCELFQPSSTLLTGLETEPRAEGSTATVIAQTASASPPLSKGGTGGVLATAPQTFIPQFDTSIVTPRNRNRSNRGLQIGTAALAAAVLLGVLIFKFTTRDGTLVVHLKDVNPAEVLVDGQKVEFQQTDGGKSLHVAIHPGDRKITLKTKDGTELVTSVGKEKVKIRAGKSAEIEAWMEAPVVLWPASGNDPDRRAAEWVLSIGGKVSVNHQTNTTINAISELPTKRFLLTAVDLVNNPNITDAGLAQLRDCKNLTVLGLVGTQVTDAGLDHLANLTELTNLSLHGVVAITDEGIALLRPLRKLENLAVSYCRITDAALETISGFDELTWLSIAHDRGITDAGLRHLRRAKKLRSLGSQDTNVTDAGVNELAAALPACKIEWDGGVIEPQPSSDPDRRAAEWVLSVGGTIGIKENDHERGIAAVSELPRMVFELTVVSLDTDAKVNDAGLALFQDCSHLKYLYLHNTQVSDAGLAHFKDCRKLTQLHLNHTQVSDAGLAQIKDFKNLTVLDLEDTRISDAGLERLADYPRLNLVSVKDTQVTAEGVKKLAAALPQCKIHWDGGVIEPKPSSDPDRRAAEWALSKGGQVSIRIGEKAQRVQTATELPTSPFQVVSIDLRGTPTTDAELVNLAGLEQLADVRLENTEVTSAGLTHLARLNQLAGLRLSGAQITDAALIHLKPLKTLNGLYLYNTKVSDVGLLELQSFPQLEDLRLWDTIVGDTGLKHLGRLTKLTHLTLVNSRVTDAGLAHLRDIQNLAFVTLSDEPVSDNGLAQLQGMKQLKWLQLTRTKNITLDGIQRLHAALPTCRIVSDHGTFEPPGAAPDRRVAEWVLSMGGRVIILAADTERECESTADLPSGDFSLFRINFDQNSKLTDADLVQIRGCHELIDLNLSLTKITDDGLAQLRDLPQLRYVALLGTKISDRGIAHLAEFPTLEGLTLIGTGITDASVSHLQRLPNLLALRVDETKITPAGMEALRKALPKCLINVLAGLDRSVAEWVLSSGGQVWAQVANQEQELLAGKLPDVEFTVRHVFFDDKHRLGTDFSALQRLVELPHLRMVRLSNISLSDEDLARLNGCRELEHLNIAACPRISGTGLAALKLPHLERLELSTIRITDSELRSVAGFPLLVSLNLQQISITDAGLDHLKTLKQLENLSLKETAVTDAGLEQLADCQTLKSLNVSGTKVTEAGVKKFVARLPACRIEWDGGVIEPVQK